MTESVTLKASSQKSENIISEVELIPAGAKGYRVYDFLVRDHQVGHSFIISIAVKQLPNRFDDIRFFLFDDAQFSLWSINQSAVSLILAPSVIRADLVFKPKSIGRYHAVLDNRHSTFTSKAVTFTVSEEWVAEQEMPPTVSVETKVSPKGKPKIWSRIVGWFRAVPIVASILVFLGVEALFGSFGIVVASHLAPVLGLKSGDPWPFIAALAFGGIAILGIFYATLTGRPLPMPAPMN
jgi:hypothetical protein